MKVDKTKRQISPLENICTIRTGKKDANHADENGVYPFFTCGTYPLKSTTYSFEGQNLIVPGNGDIGRCFFYNGKIEAYQRTYVIQLKTNSDIDIHYLYSVFKGTWRAYIKNKILGAAMPYIKLVHLNKFPIPIYDLDVQQAIAAELDAIQIMIDGYKAQIADLDNLAQSIFLDMFGDPVTNPKGWETKTFGDLGIIERGAGISKKDFVANGLPCIHYGQLHTTLEACTKKHLTCIPENLLLKYKIAHPGDVILAITSEDVEGSCKSTVWLGKYDIIVGSDAAIFHHKQNGVYISYYTMTKAFYYEKAKYAKGFKVTHISTKEIESIHIPLPPLPLQQLFASKVEAIELQKEQLRLQLQDAETLMAERMQYYFS